MPISKNDVNFLKSLISQYEATHGKLEAEKIPHAGGCGSGRGCMGSCYCATTPNK